MVEIKKRSTARWKVLCQDTQATQRGKKMRHICFDDGKGLNTVDDLKEKLEECLTKL